MSAEKFIDLLKDRDLIPPEMIEQLRAQVAESRQLVSAKKIANALINSGHLTPAIAKRLLDAAEEAPGTTPATRASTISCSTAP